MSLRSGMHKTGMVCLAPIAAILAFALPLRCFPTALAVGGVSLAAGAGLGYSLARITRTRSPLWIYTWIVLSALTLWPLYHGWPPGDASDVIAWKGAPDIVDNYFDFVRGGIYLLSFPYPFALFGQHSADPVAGE